jgi:hypothetical protein
MQIAMHMSHGAIGYSRRHRTRKQSIVVATKEERFFFGKIWIEAWGKEICLFFGSKKLTNSFIGRVQFAR